MVIRYFDKDGKEHRMNFNSNKPIFISSEVGNTGKPVEFRIDEHLEYSKVLGSYATCGKFNIRVASAHQGMAVYPVSNSEIRLGSLDGPNR